MPLIQLLSQRRFGIIVYREHNDIWGLYVVRKVLSGMSTGARLCPSAWYTKVSVSRYASFGVTFNSLQLRHFMYICQPIDKGNL